MTARPSDVALTAAGAVSCHSGPSGPPPSALHKTPRPAISPKKRRDLGVGWVCGCRPDHRGRRRDARVAGDSLGEGRAPAAHGPPRQAGLAAACAWWTADRRNGALGACSGPPDLVAVSPRMRNTAGTKGATALPGMGRVVATASGDTAADRVREELPTQPPPARTRPGCRSVRFPAPSPSRWRTPHP